MNSDNRWSAGVLISLVVIVAIVVGVVGINKYAKDHPSSASADSSITGDSSSDESAEQLQADLDNAKDCLAQSKAYIGGLQQTIDDTSDTLDGDYDDMHEAIGSMSYDSTPYCLDEY